VAPRASDLLELASDYLVRQGWFKAASSTEPPGAFELVTFQPIRDEIPGLARMLIERGDQRFQLLVGWRPSTEISGVLRGEESALLGAVVDGEERLIVYDALADDELCRVILEVATDGAERATRVRPVASLPSHASLVFDERLFMKCYRVLEDRTRPEVEVMFGLDAVGFHAMLSPIARWRDHDVDLGLVRQFLPSALEGRLLALTSLRDLLGHASGEGAAFQATGTSEDLDRMAGLAGGDLAAEADRLGGTTAHLHLALAEAFGTRPLVAGDFSSLANGGALEVILADPGPEALGVAIRLHGDYHLRRVMRSETGWLVAGFGDDPLYAIAPPDPTGAPRTGSPLEDVADMTFALGQVVVDALAQRSQGGHDRSVDLAAAWRRRNRRAFLNGYFRTEGVDALLPGDPSHREILLESLEEIRERRYEATTSSE
jgi:maltokinase